MTTETISTLTATSAGQDSQKEINSGSGPDVLVFDDDKIVHDMWRRSANREAVATRHFDSWEDFVDRDAFQLAKDSIAFVDINYRGSRFDGLDIAKNLRQLGARFLYAITAEPSKAKASGLFDDVLGKECPEELARFLSERRRRE